MCESVFKTTDTSADKSQLKRASSLVPALFHWIQIWTIDNAFFQFISARIELLVVAVIAQFGLGTIRIRKAICLQCVCSFVCCCAGQQRRPSPQQRHLAEKPHTIYWPFQLPICGERCSNWFKSHMNCMHIDHSGACIMGGKTWHIQKICQRLIQRCIN